MCVYMWQSAACKQSRRSNGGGPVTSQCLSDLSWGQWTCRLNLQHTSPCLFKLPVFPSLHVSVMTSYQFLCQLLIFMQSTCTWGSATELQVPDWQPAAWQGGLFCPYLSGVQRMACRISCCRHVPAEWGTWTCQIILSYQQCKVHYLCHCLVSHITCK